MYMIRGYMACKINGFLSAYNSTYCDSVFLYVTNCGDYTITLSAFSAGVSFAFVLAQLRLILGRYAGKQFRLLFVTFFALFYLQPLKIAIQCTMLVCKW